MIGSFQEAANPRFTSTVTSAPDVEKQAMAHRPALEPKRLRATSPYTPSAWQTELACLGLLPRYPDIVEGLSSSFLLGIPPISCTYTPPNYSSILHLPDVYKATVENEFAAGRYVGPFSRAQMENELGPFQTSPLSFVPKVSKPGKY
jgi:hypothetical protein